MSAPATGRPTQPTRVSRKGQVTVPKPVRDHLGIQPGSAVEFEVTHSGDVVLRKRPDSARPLRRLLAGYATTPVPSVDALNAGVGREVARLDALARQPDTPGAGEVDATASDA